MKKSYLLFFLLGTVGLAPVVLASASSLNQSSAKGLTLHGAYTLALKRSEDVALTKEALSAAQAHFYQAFDVILPKLHYSMTFFEQDAPEELSESGDSGGNSLRRTTPTSKFTFSQPIFSGFKELAVLQGSGAEKAQRRFQIQRAKELLLIDVAKAFYTTLQAEHDVAVLEKIHEITDKRRTDLAERTRIGRSRDSEVQTALSDAKVIEADIEEAKRLAAVTRQLLEFYVGQKISEGLSDEEDDVLSFDENSGDAKKAKNRADVKAAEKAKILADKKVMAARSGLFPKVSLDGNYYTRRTGFQSGIDWDVLLSVDVPIFDKLNTFGDIKLAGSERKSAELTLQKTERLAELDIQNTGEALQSSRRIERKLAEAAEASKKNYELLSEDYLHNLVNNLDVLDALRQYQDVDRRWNQARYHAKINYWKFKVALGEVSL